MSRNMPNSWSRIRREWLEHNPPDKDGFYICWLCKTPVHVSKVTIDHVAPLKDYPEYAKDEANMRPAHQICNENRASGLIQNFTRIANRRFGRKRWNSTGK